MPGREPREVLEHEDGQLLSEKVRSGRSRVNDHRGLVATSLGRITKHDPKQLELRQAEEDVDARSFRGSQLVFKPNEDDLVGEQELKHQLGRVPTGFWLVAADIPVQVIATAAQRKRWTREKIFVFVDNAAAIEHGIGSILADSPVFTFRTPLFAANPFVVFGSPQQGSVADFVDLRVSSWKDEDGNNTTTPPYFGMQVNTSHGAGLSPDTWNFSWSVYDVITKDTELTLQVF